ncbi:RidA family protein [Cellulomonas pakistanensis]|uniref:Enamine deaminase RidA n=1 Tax=Cellulomonas pakistanensis TaxID=992287 RepID=A0A919P5Y7_9CELL|nr:RidA family protein [Cellulomonas pakistanensis]GIG34716.1 enamine deaminase RidA [Cellulomonas pakistanensis]
MAVQLLDPVGLGTEVPYRHVAVSRGTRQVHVAGQIGAGSPEAPGDLADQVAEALRNVGRGLAGAGATFADVVRLTFYVTEWEGSHQLPEFLAGVDRVRAELGIAESLPPASLIGVQILFEPHVRVEVEATAVLD